LRAGEGVLGGAVAGMWVYEDRGFGLEFGGDVDVEADFCRVGADVGCDLDEGVGCAEGGRWEGEEGK